MPRDTQIVRSAPSDAPKDYTVDKNVELILRGVTAQFADNGAGGDWLPCVELISDSGHLIARCCDPNVKVAAGDDAEVTWFPDVKPSGSGAAPSSASVAFASGTGGPQTVSAGTSAFAGFSSVRVSDPSIFTWSTTTLPNDTLTVSTAGVAVCVASALWNVGVGNGNIFVHGSFGDVFRHSGWLTLQAFGDAPPAGFSDIMDQAWLDLSGSNGQIKLGLSNDNGFDTGPNSYTMSVLFFVGAEA